MSFVSNVKERAKSCLKTIILPESEDARILKAASNALSEGYARIILLGDRAEVLASADALGLSLEGAEIVNPRTSDKLDAYAEKLAELRKNKGMTFEKARETMLEDTTVFGVMAVKMGDADGLVSGAIHTSANMLRPVLQIIKTAPEKSLVSNAFIFDIPDPSFGANGVILCADCALNQDPNSEELAEIAADSAESFEVLVGEKARVAFLSHSSFGSASHPLVTKVSEAVRIAKERHPEIMIDGEMQLDAALIPEVAASKAPDSPVAGKANVLIFPNIDAGNIGYKLIQRIGKAEAYSLIQGLNAPCNDLSRGCLWEDVAGVIAITAIQAQGKK